MHHHFITNGSLKTFILLLLPLFLWLAAREFCEISFDRDIGGHLKRAADANSVELAVGEIDTGIKQMEHRRLTSGYTSLLYQTPDEDIGFWYTNIKICSTQLHALPPTSTQGEKDMVLLKLRQTLLDHTGHGEKVTAPMGISIAPYNWIWFILGVASCIPIVSYRLYPFVRQIEVI